MGGDESGEKKGNRNDKWVAIVLLGSIYLSHFYMSSKLMPLKREFYSGQRYALEVVEERNRVLMKHGYIILGQWDDTFGCGLAFYVWCPPLAKLKIYPKPFDTYQ